MRKFISVLLAGVLAIGVFAGCGGNSGGSGGIEGNGGRAVSDGKMIYYVDIVQYQIRRVAVDDLSAESELVYNGGAESLSLSKDGRLYFSNSGSNTISCIKPEDDEATDFVEFNSTAVRPVVLSEDEKWLYFSANDQNGKYPKGIYRIDVNTSAVETVVDEEVSGFSLMGDSLYYITNGTLMKKNINDGTSSLLIEVFDENVIEFHVTDEYIYYRLYGDKVIRRCDLDGQKEKVIYTADENKSIIVAFADKDFVYFANGGEDGFYRIKSDGTGIEQINSRELDETGDIAWSSAAFVAGKIFVRVYSDGSGGGLYCLDRDGKNGFRLK